MGTEATADRLLAWHLCARLAAEGVSWAGPLAPGSEPPVAGTRMPWEALCALWERALGDVDDPETLPLRVARHIAPGAHASPLTHYTRASSSIAEAVTRITEGYSAVTDAFAWHLVRRRAGPLLVADRGPLGTRGEQALLGFLVVEAVRTGREMTGGRWHPRVVRVPHPIQQLDAWERAVHAAVEADATHLAIGFHPGDLALTPVSADPSLSRILGAHVEQLAVRPPEADLPSAVRREIRVQLQSGVPSLQATARMLGMSPRSVTRHLGRAGTGFRALCDEVRLELARELLAQHEPEEVAARLGFAELRPFQRAFRRWTGQGLRAYLDAQRQASDT